QESLFASQEKFFQDLFDSELASQATAEFEKAMKELAEEEPHLVEQFQKLSEAAGRVGERRRAPGAATAPAENADPAWVPGAFWLPAVPAAAASARGALDVAPLPFCPAGSIVPLMQNIMQNLLSKEVLYPSLKEITEKYPEWLRLHRGRLSPEQYDKYREQHSIMGKICEQFEAERPTDGEAEHRARFEAVLDLMQQLQDLGHPPKELAGESPPGLNVDLEGLSLPDAATAAGEQCRLM
ncbi:PEX19 factor, partial [Nothoprocta ornata]|nr:PEX19 factor [Nothoprocta ornata]